MKKIVIFPADVLRLKSEPVREENINPELEKNVKVLIKVLSNGENAAGLAAPQLGWNRRFFGIKNNKKEVNAFINPVILGTFGEKIFPKLVDKNNSEEDFLEGCLSIPNYYGTVKRFLRINAGWQEIKNGKLVEKSRILEGFEAIVFQHELDHLNGILFVDHVKEDEGKFFKDVNKKMIKWSLDRITF
jgi:peptide deformylase